MKSTSTFENFLEKHRNWEGPLVRFRKLLLETDLVETIKWGIPVYTVNNKNVVGIGAFRSYVGMWFFQGSFLSDPDKVLVNAQDGKTKGMRQLRYTSMDDIDDDLIRKYLKEAIQNQKDGKEIKPDRAKSITIPDELNIALSQDQDLNASFQRLTKGKQREYAQFILDAKRQETKQKRLEKIIPMILKSIGLNDRYK